MPTTPETPHKRPARSPRLVLGLTLSLAACLGLPVGQAGAAGADGTPPKITRLPKISEARCSDKLIRRGSFLGVYTGQADAGSIYAQASFILPSGQTAKIDCYKEEAEKWYAGQRQGTVVPVRYEVRRMWDTPSRSCMGRPVCVAPPKARKRR